MKKIMFNETYRLQTAVLERWKTMTRRFVPEGTPCGCWSETVKYSRYQVGEIVAIAQSYESIYNENGLETMDMLVSRLKNHKGWRNKLFVRADLMPHHIRITDVKIERLQDISDKDCIKEGVEPQEWSSGIGNTYLIQCPWPKHLFDGQWQGYGTGCNEYYYKHFDTHREAFAFLIDRVSGKGTWESNPYVFVYEFELVD